MTTDTTGLVAELRTTDAGICDHGLKSWPIDDVVMLLRRVADALEAKAAPEVTGEMLNAACTAYKGERYMVDRAAMMKALTADLQPKGKGR